MACADDPRARYWVQVKDLYGRVTASWINLSLYEARRLVKTWPLAPGERIRYAQEGTP